MGCNYISHKIIGVITYPCPIGPCGGFCLTAPSHYRNQCCFLYSEILWYSLMSKSTAASQDTILYKNLDIHTFKITATFPRGQWVNSLWPRDATLGLRYIWKLNLSPTFSNTHSISSWHALPSSSFYDGNQWPRGCHTSRPYRWRMARQGAFYICTRQWRCPGSHRRDLRRNCEASLAATGESKESILRYSAGML